MIPEPEPERWPLVWPGDRPEYRVEMAFRLIPAGAFRMGSRGYFSEEEPIHQVRIVDPFWIAETPVTQAQFSLWTRAESLEHENHFKARPEHPAENMDWRQAVAYCDWLTRAKGAEFPEGFHLACLPTEAQWEYACRGKTETEYYTGDGEAALVETGWFGEEWGVGATHPVAQKAPNLFKLYDLHGNVWEWCGDVFDPRAYRKRVDGWDAREWTLADAGSDALYWSDDDRRQQNAARVLRGGSWFNSAGDCRSAYRSWFRPGDRYRGVGFRVCLVRGQACQPDRQAEPAPGDGGRGTRPESDGAGGAGTVMPNLAQAAFPRAAGRKKSKKPKRS